VIRGGGSARTAAAAKAVKVNVVIVNNITRKRCHANFSSVVSHSKKESESGKNWQKNSSLRRLPTF
jgi:hypothetical protein